MGALVDTPPITIKDGGIFRDGYSAELDSYRNARTSAKRWLSEYEAKEREETGIKQLKVGYNRPRSPNLLNLDKYVFFYNTKSPLCYPIGLEAK